MKLKEFFTFKHNKLFWLNILGMVAVVIAVIWGTFYYLDVYTIHGKAIQVPDVTGLQAEKAAEVLMKSNLSGEAVDFRFVKGVPENRVLEQRPAANAKVKKGRTIYLTLSTGNEPTYAIPDIIDNCSLREAEAKLQAAGFKLTPCDSINGEKDWVYGLLHGTDTLHAGDRIPMGTTLTLIIGNGEEASSEEEESEATVEDSWFE